MRSQGFGSERLLIRAASPTDHPAPRVVLGLPGIESLGAGESAPTLVVSRVGDGLGASWRVPADRPARLARVVDGALDGRATQLWIRDRHRLQKALGDATGDVEWVLARLAADQNVPFIGWTGERGDAVAERDAYEEVRESYRPSDLPGARRERQ